MDRVRAECTPRGRYACLVYGRLAPCGRALCPGSSKSHDTHRRAIHRPAAVASEGPRSLLLCSSSLLGRRRSGSSRRSTATRTGRSRGARTLPRILEPIRGQHVGGRARKAGTLMGAGRGQLRHASWRVRRLGWAPRLGVGPACTMRRLPAAWARICAAAVLLPPGRGALLRCCSGLLPMCLCSL